MKIRDNFFKVLEGKMKYLNASAKSELIEKQMNSLKDHMNPRNSSATIGK